MKEDYSLKVETEPVQYEKGGKKFISYKLTSSPITSDFLKSFPEHGSDYHPFQEVLAHAGEDVGLLEQLARGILSDIVADNAVTRSILDMLSNEEAAIAQCGNKQWEVYRTKLVYALHTLWD